MSKRFAFCGWCRRAKYENMDFKRHKASTLHISCEVCRLVLIGEVAAKRYAEKKDICAKDMRCVRCETKTTDQHDCTALDGDEDDSDEHKRGGEACPEEGCAVWLVSTEQAILHLSDCARLNERFQCADKAIERVIKRWNKEKKSKDTCLHQWDPELMHIILNDLREKGGCSEPLLQAIAVETRSARPMELSAGEMMAIHHRSRDMSSLGLAKTKGFLELAKQDHGPVHKTAQMGNNISPFIRTLRRTRPGNPISAVDLQRVEHGERFDKDEWAAAKPRQALILLARVGRPELSLLVLQGENDTMSQTAVNEWLQA